MLTVCQGESVGLIGPNGSGKTTLCMVVSGLLKQDRGLIELAGQRVGLKDLRRYVKCAFQNPNSQIFADTVEEEIQFGFYYSGLDRIELEKRLEWVYSVLPFNRHQSPHDLSYGQKKLLSLIATLTLRPKLLLLDEPLASLDFKTVQLVHSLLQNYVDGGGSILILSHRIDDLASFCGRMVAMDHGKIVSLGFSNVGKDS
jgi:energy-coupling factor transporter ATP-binding protein EcfA2